MPVPAMDASNSRTSCPPLHGCFPPAFVTAAMYCKLCHNALKLVGFRVHPLTGRWCFATDADEQMVDASAAALMQSLKLNQGRVELPVDDAKLQAFMRPPRTPSPPDMRSPSFAPRHSGLRPNSSPHQHAHPTGRHLAGIGSSQMNQQVHSGAHVDAMRQAWEDDMAELQLHDRMGSDGAPWVADFADRPRLQGHHSQVALDKSAWAAEFGDRLQLGQKRPFQVILAIRYAQQGLMLVRIDTDSSTAVTSCWAASGLHLCEVGNAVVQGCQHAMRLSKISRSARGISMCRLRHHVCACQALCAERTTFTLLGCTLII